MSKIDMLVTREPVSLEDTLQEIDDVFVFNPPQSQENLTKCLTIQNACKSLASLIARDVPEGKEQTIAINSLLATALWANHGILRRQVVVVAVSQPENPT
jgi:hypothetical protein